MPLVFHDPEWVCDQCETRVAAPLDDGDDSLGTPVPPGWISLTRHVFNDNDDEQLTLCSLECLVKWARQDSEEEKP